MQYVAPEQQRQQDNSAKRKVKKVFESSFESQEDPPPEVRERMAVMIRWKLTLFFLRTLESECQLQENQNTSNLVNQHQ